MPPLRPRATVAGMTIQFPAVVGTRSRRATLALGLTAALATLTTASPAHAADPLPGRHGELRLCDPTACYVAWQVVDSDHDGVCDADELAAGTDPYDPASLPGMPQLVELTVGRGLPSFEAGLAVLTMLPPELLDLREVRSGLPQLGGLSVPTRGELLKRLGISTDLLAEYGISPDRDGLTVGLDTVGSKDAPPGVRVAGIDMSLLAAGTYESVPFVKNGGVFLIRPNSAGDGHITDFVDGSRDESHQDAYGVTIQHTNADGSRGETRLIQTRDTSDGTTRSHTEKATVTEAGGNVKTVTMTETHELSDGAASILTVTKEFIRDQNGNVTGTVVTTTVSYRSADGEYSSSAKTVESCDADGKNCTEVSYEYQDSDTVDDGGYVDPDAGPTIVTEEMVDGALRTRGAAVTVVEGWTPPKVDGSPVDPKHVGGVILVAPDLAEQYLLVGPARVTTAQPEARPDLPNPREAAPQTGGGCGTISVC